ncbi:hypothetical protein [Roseibium album]|uniref:hypothetical protein n=1 Tax=Roseibium album TaxID=311410 RepID=UPI003BAF0829
MQIDPSETIKIRRSVRYLLLGFVISLPLSILCAFACYHSIATGEFLTKGGLSTAFGTLFFGAIAFFSITQLWNADRPVIMIGPAGFFDKRVFEKAVPWHEITEIRVDEFGFFGALFIEVTDRIYLLPRYRILFKTWFNQGPGASGSYPLDGLAFDREKLGFLLDQYSSAWRHPPDNMQPSALNVVDRHFPPVC